MSNFTKQKLTAACGNNLDQISNITSQIAAQASASGFIAGAGNGGNGGDGS